MRTERHDCAECGERQVACVRFDTAAGLVFICAECIKRALIALERGADRPEH